MEDTWERMVRSALIITSFMKMAAVRGSFLRKRAAASRLAAGRRGQLSRRAYTILLAQHRAALRVQRRWRAHRARMALRAAVSRVWALQMAWRRKMLRRRLAARRAARMAELEAEEAELAVTRAEAARWDRIRDDFGGDWEAIRATMTWAASLQAAHGGREGVEAVLAAAAAGPPAASAAAPLAAAPAVAARAVAAVPTAEAEALAAEVARLSADREALLDELTAERGRREEVEEKLEGAEEQWMAQMGTLQKVVATVKADLLGNALPGDVRALLGGGLTGQLPAHHSAPTQSGRIPAMRAAAEPESLESRTAKQAVQRLKDDLEMRTQVYDDDIEFIREVKEGRTEAPDMDPAFELKNLSQRFEVWKRDFKQRIHEVRAVPCTQPRICQVALCHGLSTAPR